MAQLIVGNWKMNGSLNLLSEFEQGFISKRESEAETVICPPAVFLHQAMSGKQFKIGAQDCSDANSGARTGEISASMLSSLGVEYVIVGHSERRSLHLESDDICAAKAKIAQQNQLTPIFCVGEDRESYESKLTQNVLLRQLEPLKNHKVLLEKLVIAYEPVWSIGTGLLPKDDDIISALKTIRGWITDSANDEVAQEGKLLYGGSVNSNNAANILNLPHVDGVLVGGASLTFSEFSKIISAA